MPRSPSGRIISLLISSALIAGATLAMSHALAANTSLGPPMWDGDHDPGMQLEARPPVERHSATPPSAPAPLPSPAARSATAAVPAAEAPHGNPLWAVPLRVLHNTRERPLFSSSRRPPPAAAATPAAVAVAAPPPPPPKPSQPDLKLVGTIIGDRDGIGVFVEDGTAQLLRLRTGEGHQGWVLREVDLRQVTLVNATTRAVLALPATGSDLQAAIPSPYARGTRRVHH
jgi:general secretion pathway protein N